MGVMIMMGDSDSEDVPCLPADTLAILQQFQLEQQAKLKKLESSCQNKNDQSVDIEIDEDWQLSQFWYDEKTATLLAKEAVRCAGREGRIALISCPTLYQPILRQKDHGCSVTLFEFDKRFSVYGDNFIFYDYNCPSEVPSNLAKSFDVVIADPPFLSDECLSKVAITIRLLTKDKIILCTGAIMHKLAENLLSLKKCKFEPRHKNNLGNEFGCFANYGLDNFLEE